MAARDAGLPRNDEEGLAIVLTGLKERHPDWNDSLLAHALFLYSRMFDGYPLTTTANNKEARAKDP